MTDFLTVLTSKGPRLTKRWTVEGVVPQDKAKRFSVEALNVDSIAGLSAVLSNIENLPMVCVIRGLYKGGEGSTVEDTEKTLEYFVDAPHRWLCLDIDGFEPVLWDPVTETHGAVREFIQTRLPPEFHGAAHHWQLSSSAGAPGKEGILKLHLWFMLDREVHGYQLEAWQRWSKTPVDVTVFRTVQWHYTAAPLFDEGVVDPVPVRSAFVAGRPEVAIVLAPDEWVYSGAAVERGSLRDPTLKSGVIGAFCRAYDPRRAVDELLPDVFTWESDDNDVRLTWLQGGGNPGGACVTDDGAHVFNGHATDPFLGRACNVWDLVRVHKYGHLDQGASDFELDSMSTTPSYVAMREWARTLPDVQAELLDDALAPQPAARAEEEPPEAKGGNSETARSANGEGAALKARTTAESEAEQRIVRLLSRLVECTTASDLEAKAQLFRDLELSISERARVVATIQKQFKALGAPMAVADARRLVTPVRAVNGAAPAWLADWVFVTNGETFFDLRTKTNVSKRAFDALHTEQMAHIQGTELRENASRWAIDAWAITTVNNTTYAPGMPPTFSMLGAQWANTYREESVPALEPAGGEDAIEIVARHFEMLFPDARERGLLLSWLAHNVKHPGQKLRWAPYIYGPQGCGKSFILNLMAGIMGPENVRILDGATLKSDFNGWATGQALTGIEEVYQAGHLYNTAEKLKAPIANDTVDVHKKGKDSYPAPNFTNYLLLSNHMDGMPIDNGDRRMFIVKCAVDTGSARLLSSTGYFDTLFGALKANVGALRRWMLQDIAEHSEFEAEGRAPVTAAREAVVQMGKSDSALMVEGLLEGKQFVLNHWLTQMLEQSGFDVPKGPALAKVIERCGFIPHKVMRIDGIPRRVWRLDGLIENLDDDEAVRNAIRNAQKSVVHDDFED